MFALRHRLGFVTALLLAFTLLFGELACGCGPHDEAEEHADPEAVPCVCIAHSGAVEAPAIVSSVQPIVRPLVQRSANDRVPDFRLCNPIFQPPRADASPSLRALSA